MDQDLPAVPDKTEISKITRAQLDAESIDLLNQVIAESDSDKAKDLTYLFNVNQNKKTMIRVNKLNELLDTITDQAILRFTTHPDNISNQELLQSLKVVQEAIEHGQKQVSTQTEQQAPLIQINQQSVNVGADADKLSRESRENVKNAVMSILSGLGVENAVINPQEVIEIKDNEDDD